MSRSPELLEAWQAEGVEAAISKGLSGPNLAENLKSLNGLGVDLWRDKGAHGDALVVFQRVLKYGEDRNLPDEEKGWVKAAAFNASANLWRGWEDSPEISDEQAELGYRLSAFHLGLAYELKKGDLALSRAEWLQAAHQLQKGQYGVAKSGFERAAGLAERNKEMAEVRMHLAYAALAQQLADGAIDEAALSAGFEPDDDPFFSEQVITAARIFGP
ncbi:MAG: hypothetical protein JNJ45_00115 [Chthonomonas sp.]|nr:hypothetical protein [Chthonomonas sp.]